MAERPENVGILAMEVYFPTSYVAQEKLEAHDGASKGKYTIGLGQDFVGFCTDVEDVVSLSMTVVKQLLEKFSISPHSVGRLEVGSETVIDKSKSIKTHLMELFEESNGDIEGVDSTNACYGGTAALLNALNWIESSAWDGRYALVVAADIAVYAEGPARPTGGAGAVAMLIGPHAPLVMERSFTASHMAHVYDFYKPDLPSEYPVVDGKLTQSCFLKALDLSYRRFAAKFEKKEGRPFSLSKDGDFFVCHSPYNKLVQKSFGRLLYNDFLRSASLVGEEAASKLHPFGDLSHDDSLVNRDLEKTAIQLAKAQYDAKVAPTTLLPKRVGNMYCASLYAGLCSLLYSKAEGLAGKRVLMFSYGSGLAATFFSFRVNSGQSPFFLETLANSLEVEGKIKSTVEVSPEGFVAAMELAETRYGAKDFVPASTAESLRPGTFYLTKVDNLYRRSYARKSTDKSIVANGNGIHH